MLQTLEGRRKYIGVILSDEHTPGFGLGETNLIGWSTLASDPILAKTKKNNITRFWLINFLKIFYFVFLLCYILFLDKIYNN